MMARIRGLSLEFVREYVFRCLLILVDSLCLCVSSYPSCIPALIPRAGSKLLSRAKHKFSTRISILRMAKVTLFRCFTLGLHSIETKPAVALTEVRNHTELRALSKRSQRTFPRQRPIIARVQEQRWFVVLLLMVSIRRSQIGCQ